MNNINIRKLLRLTYLTLYNDGIKQISLKEEALEKYIPKLEEIVFKNNIDDKDLFIKTPILESYNNYIAFLIETFTSTGYLDYKYDSIILNHKEQLVKKELEENKNYHFLINECCNAIKGIEKENEKKHIKIISNMPNML